MKFILSILLTGCISIDPIKGYDGKIQLKTINNADGTECSFFAGRGVAIKCSF